MTLAEQIKAAAAEGLKTLFPDAEVSAASITLNETKPEFEGDYTIVLFPFLKTLRQKPAELGAALGGWLVENTQLFSAHSTVAGFLNLSLRDDYWEDFLLNHFNDAHWGEAPKGTTRTMVEYSSPNTNKPLHFGHLRNNFLGWSVSEILKARGQQVVKANLVNDRGIHICKSMVAWQRYAGGATPESTGVKGDHLVGDYYVRYNDEVNKEIAPTLQALYENYSKSSIPDYVQGLRRTTVEQALDLLGGTDGEVNQLQGHTSPLTAEMYADISGEMVEAVQRAKDEGKGWAKAARMIEQFLSENPKKLSRDDVRFQKLKYAASHENAINTNKGEIKEAIASYSSLAKEAQECLRKWEAGEEATMNLWREMNGWVYKGFDETYRRLGLDFDAMYYESDTYLLGKAIVEKGLERGLLYKKEDGSVWASLQDTGLDDKLLLRGDGTSVYMTQDLGTAVKKWNDYKLDRSIYVIGDEQNHHMVVLKTILEKLGEPVATGIHHLSYGMVELPSGRMKSREGTVVDADDMIDEMVTLAKEQTEAAGKTEGFSFDELQKLYETIGLGALKFYLLRVDPKKKMVFDPKESIDLHGYTATFIQYAHARIHSILRKEGLSATVDRTHFQTFELTQPVLKAEKAILLQLEKYPQILAEAAEELAPSVVCSYAFGLAQAFNTFYDEHSVARAENEEKKALRLMIIVMTAGVLKHAMALLGIRVPEKM